MQSTWGVEGDMEGDAEGDSTDWDSSSAASSGEIPTDEIPESLGSLRRFRSARRNSATITAPSPSATQTSGPASSEASLSSTHRLPEPAGNGARHRTRRDPGALH